MRHLRWARALGAILVALAGFIAGTAHGTSAAGAAGKGATFNDPEGMVLVGSDLWVASANGNALVELCASNGSLIRTVGAKGDDLIGPEAIASNGRYLWVANLGFGVTELNASNGKLVRVIRPSANGISGPFGIAYGDGHVWVTSGGNARHNSKVVELNPANGSIVRTLQKGIYDATGITIDGRNVWIVNQQNNSVAEYNATDGSFIRVLSARRYRFDYPLEIKPAGNDLWVSNGVGGYSMTEINAANGSFVRVVKKSHRWLADPYPPSSAEGGASPWGISVDGNYVWIADSWNVVEISATTGELVRVVSARADDLAYAQYVLAFGNRVWVSDSTQGDGGTVTELTASTGALVRDIGKS